MCSGHSVTYPHACAKRSTSTITALPVAPRTRRDVILEYTDNRSTTLACPAYVALCHDITELTACAKESLGTATAQSVAPRPRRDGVIIPPSTACAALAHNEELGVRDGRKVAVLRAHFCGDGHH